MWRTRRTQALALAAVQAETAQLQVEALRTELTEMHRALAHRDIELLATLTRLADATDALRDRTERQDVTQRKLTRALQLLTMFAAAPPLAAARGNGTGEDARRPDPADQGAGVVIGGTVDPARAAPAVLVGDDPTTTIDLTAELPVAPETRRDAPLQCEVHLQFGDSWIDGFQIEETIRDADSVQYRLRRMVDGWILPELFAESEVRVFTQPVPRSAAGPGTS
jgi:hypothetical protein